MSHTDQLNKPKYRNWVKGGLTFKYLKEGLQEYAEIVVHREHNNILQKCGIKSGLTCSSNCSLQTLLPLHQSNRDLVLRRLTCPYGHKQCNCIYPKHKSPCANKICDRIYEEILKNHASKPPCPEWGNTDITKWTTSPWEVAKVYIKAKGYSDKLSAEDMDCTGLLHIFINNRAYIRSVSTSTRSIMDEMRKRRNILFHSSSMELDDAKLDTWINDAILILQDRKVNVTNGAIAALANLNQISFIGHNLEVWTPGNKATISLQNKGICITTKSEAEILKTATTEVFKKLEELNTRTMDAKDEISSHSKRAIADINAAHRQSACIQQQQIIDNVRQNLDNIKTILQELKTAVAEQFSKRVANLEKKFSTFETRDNEFRKQLKQVEGRLELRKSLADLYRNNCVQTSACPLKPRENDIDIRDVYVKPVITKEVKKRSIKRGTMQVVPIEKYNDIFENDWACFKRIYVVGDMGSGKSAFCKIMIDNWCESVQKQIQDGSETFSKSGQSDNFDYNEMLKFEFLFFIPLRTLSGISDVRQMVEKYYSKQIPPDILNNVLDNCQERCLILADGLDEWMPTQRSHVPEHMTGTLLDASSIRHVTLITTSRPSAPGILAMKSSEYDQKLFLDGIPENSIKNLVHKYLSILKDTDLVSDLVEIVLNCLQNGKFPFIERTPLLLQQIAWLAGIGSAVGETIGEVYSNLLNICLKWAEGKTEQQTTDHFQNNENLVLPNAFEKYYQCCKNRTLIFALGRIAFELFIQRNGSSMTFGRHFLDEIKVCDETLQTLLKTGLLTEENCFDPTNENTKVSFTHSSFLEYFVAVYIASSEETNMQIYSRQTDDGTQRHVLKRLLKLIKSVQHILQFFNVFVFICGFAPHFTQKVCDDIVDATQNDKHYVEMLQVYINSKNFEMPFLFVNLQNLVVECLSESKSNAKVQIPFIVLNNFASVDGDTKVLKVLQRNFVSHSLLHLFLCNSDQEKVQKVSAFSKLQTIILSSAKLNHGTLSTLSQYLTKTLTLRIIRISSISCADDHGTPCNNAVDLCQNKLHYLQVHCCNVLKFTNINTWRIVTDSVEVLRELKRTTNVRDLEINTTETTQNLSENDVSILSSLITQRISLESIHLSCNLCDREAKTHEIDLSLHNKLRKLNVNMPSLAFKNINKINISQCTTSNTDVLLSLRNARKLDTLNIQCPSGEELKYDTRVHGIILTLDGLQKLRLQFVQIDDDVFQMTPEMKSLRNIELNKVKMSQSSWCKFVDSLITLSQTVTVEIAITNTFDADIERDYVRNAHESYEVIHDSFNFFSFKTKITTTPK